MIKLGLKCICTCVKNVKEITFLLLFLMLLVLFMKVPSIKLQIRHNKNLNWIANLYTEKGVSKFLSREAFQVDSVNYLHGNIKHNFNSNILLKENLSMSDLWPLFGGEVEDRIEKQMSYQPEVTSWKTILMFGWSMTEAQHGNQRLMGEHCPVTNCTITSNRNTFHKSDAVIFSNAVPPSERPAGQIWVYYNLESPLHQEPGLASAFAFNFTATYRMDSVLVTPYGKLVKIQKANPHPRKDYAAGKNKLVGWFVSNCRGSNGRMEYVNELQKYINVDIYGSCGELMCSKSDQDNCFELLNREYKFYLAFENSNCVEYITEKFFTNGLSNEVVPVVMGARREDYEAVAPPNSFIHVDDFYSPKDLANYLLMLDQRDDLYNRYFTWKGTMKSINTKFFCRLCTMIHAADHHRFMYKNVTDWWVNDTCIHPQSHKWASWRK